MSTLEFGKWRTRTSNNVYIMEECIPNTKYMGDQAGGSNYSREWISFGHSTVDDQGSGASRLFLAIAYNTINYSIVCSTNMSDVTFASNVRQHSTVLWVPGTSYYDVYNLQRDYLGGGGQTDAFVNVVTKGELT